MLKALQTILIASGCLAAGAGFAQELPGLVVRASDGTRTISFVAPTVAFTLHPGQSIHAQLKPAFEAEWSGQIRILQAGRYTFKADGIVLLNDVEVQNRSAEVAAGNARILVKYARKADSPARLQLQWESEHFPSEPVPARVLFHADRNAATLAEQLAAGRALIEEYNCTACHASNRDFIRSRPAPSLSAVGSRVSTNWLFHWLGNPQQYRPSAKMPRLLHTVEEQADVTAYLSGLRTMNTRGPLAKVDHGEVLFKTVGCAACHGEHGVSLAGVGSKYNAGSLAEYLMDPLAVDPSGRMPNMLLVRAEADALANYLSKLRNDAFEKPGPLGDAERGRALVAGRGCLACHAMEGSQVRPATALPLSQLRAGQGCVAQMPTHSVPHFALTPVQRENINIWLRQQDVSEAPPDDVFRIVEVFNCRACHEYYRPPELETEATQGPPPLSEAGYKLRRSWLDLVLNGKKRIRPWLGLRMPHYGSNNVHRLVDYFHAQAGSDPGEGDKIPQPTMAEIQSGVHLLGRAEGGLSCINCHDFRGEPSGGEMRGPDMTEMYARIRGDWLRRFLREPQRILPGTSMPAFFSGLPPDQAESQIKKVIQGLAGGRDMPIPPGLAEAAQPFYLLVKDEPIVFRTFIEGSSPRSIAVGFPGLNSFVFDAELCRLRYAWSGDFLDVKPVWADRGGNPAKILGKRYFTAPKVSPVRVDREKEPKVAFLGYTLVQGVPVFRYKIDDVTVTERITPLRGDRMGLVRRFTVSQDAWYMKDQPVRLAPDKPFEVEVP